MFIDAIKSWLSKPITIRIILLVAIQALIALLVDTLDLAVGTTGTFTFLQYAQNAKSGSFIILLYAPLFASDGGLGTLVSNLGTNLHLGIIKPQYMKNNKYFYTLIISTITLSTFCAFWIGLVSYFFNLVMLGPNRLINPLPFFVISFFSLALSAIIISQITCVYAFWIFKKKLNPDVFVYPVVSTANNLLTTLLYAAMIAMLKPEQWYSKSPTSVSAGPYIALVPLIFFLVFLAILIRRNINNIDFRKILRESIPVQGVVLTVNSFAGGIFSKATSFLTNFKSLFLIFPVLMDVLSDSVIIVANTTSTDLALGTLKARYKSIKEKLLWTRIIGVGVAGVILHIFLSIFGSLFAGEANLMLYVLLIALFVNILGFVIVEFLAFVMMIFSYKKGLNPNNYSAPIIASLSNFVASFFILIFSLIFSGIIK